MANVFSKLGASTYILWGILHVVVASKVYTLGQSLDADIVQARVFQDAWSLLFFALFAILIGLFLNWKNDRSGYWLNLVVVSVADIGFLIFILIPGYVPIIPGIIGPVLWILAIVFSSIAIRRNSVRSN